MFKSTRWSKVHCYIIMSILERYFAVLFFCSPEESNLFRPVLWVKVVVFMRTSLVSLKAVPLVWCHVTTFSFPGSLNRERNRENLIAHQIFAQSGSNTVTKIVKFACQ